MSRHKLLGGRRCDCLACFSYRLATWFLIAGVLAILVLSAVLHAGEPRPLLVEATGGQQ